MLIRDLHPPQHLEPIWPWRDVQPPPARPELPVKPIRHVPRPREVKLRKSYYVPTQRRIHTRICLDAVQAGEDVTAKDIQARVPLTLGQTSAAIWHLVKRRKLKKSRGEQQGSHWIQWYRRTE